MLSLEQGQVLHDRVCRGEILDEADRAELEAWYAAMDADAARLLSSPPMSGTDDAVLREQVRISLERLQTITARTREIERGNEALRQQNDELMRLLREKGVLVA